MIACQDDLTVVRPTAVGLLVTMAIDTQVIQDRLDVARKVEYVGAIREGFDPARIFVKGFGESMPLASNKSVDGRKQNRRAEILVLLPEKGN